MSEQLNELFNVEQNEEPITDLVVAEPMALVSTSEIETAKEIHINLLNKAEQALNDLLAFAKESQSPRAYEVVATLINTTSEVAKKLVQLTSNQPETQNNTQNNIFIGATSELQKMIKDNVTKIINEDDTFTE